jgi:hypothetical protein
MATVHDVFYSLIARETVQAGQMTADKVKFLGLIRPILLYGAQKNFGYSAE